MRQTALRALAALAALIVFTISSDTVLGQKGSKGGGGQDGPTYAIVPFMPDGSTSRASSVNDINAMGQAVGELEHVNGVHEAIHRDVDGVYTTLTGGAVANGINKSNEIVGWNGTTALFWTSPSALPFSLPPQTGDSISEAQAINDDGIVIGTSSGWVDDEYVTVPVVWRVFIDDDLSWQIDGPLSLPPLQSDAGLAWDINQVVDGKAQVTGESDLTAVIWTVELNADGTLAAPNPPVDIGTLDEPNEFVSEGRGINNLGDICGRSRLMPFEALAGEGPVALSVPSDTEYGYANDISDESDVVGYVRIRPRRGTATDHAYLWKDGEPTALSTVLPKQSGWERLSRAWVINSAGVIGGTGVYDVSSRGFLLFPESP